MTGKFDSTRRAGPGRLDLGLKIFAIGTYRANCGGATKFLSKAKKMFWTHGFLQPYGLLPRWAGRKKRMIIILFTQLNTSQAPVTYCTFGSHRPIWSGRIEIRFGISDNRHTGHEIRRGNDVNGQEVC